MNSNKKSFLFICYDFFPRVTPTTIRISKILKFLPTDLQINVLSQTENASTEANTILHFVRGWYPKFLIDCLLKLRLGKFLEWIIPFGNDKSFFWIGSAILKGLKLIKNSQPSAVVVFMMPYPIGIVGVILKWIMGLPLVLNFDDSPTCTDMGGNSFPSWFHYRLTEWLEDFYVRQADAVIYVSQRNLERVRDRQPEKHQDKFHLVRYGADPIDFKKDQLHTPSKEGFTITYIGGMTGWFEFYDLPNQTNLFKKIYQAWLDWGRYEVLKLDIRSSSPMFVGQAIKLMYEERPDLIGKIKLSIYGNFFPDYVINRGLENQKLRDIIFVHPSVSNQRAIQIACQSDLLFMTLPARPSDAVPGGRISAKTYEYLMTSRPILATLSKGENWDYLEGKPGVWLVEPTNVLGIKKVLQELVDKKNSGDSLTFDRTALHPELSYESRAQEFNMILTKVLR